MANKKTKICSKCKAVKPVSGFWKHSTAKDRLHPWCKVCSVSDQSVRRENSKKQEPNIKGRGIESWSQMDSVFRELAEIKLRINEEKALCEKRINLIKEYSQEQIEPCITHQTGLRSMVEDFVKKNCAGRNIKQTFRFGSLSFVEGKVRLSPNIGKAAKMRGKR